MGTQVLYRWAYHAMIAAGRPVGGIRPRRMYDWLGRRAYPQAEYAWVKNNWGTELKLSHHFHLDRNTLIFGEYDPALHRLIEARVRPGMVALDVGANLGEMALHMAQRVGPDGRVWGFEPMPAAYARLLEHIARNHMQDRVRPFQLALSHTAGECVMSFPAAESDNQGLGSLVNAHAGPVRIAVKVDTLDALVRRENLTRLDFIKVDIQGGEYGFLLGGRETLMRFRPEIVMEVSPVDLQEAGRSSRELLELVESYGYEVRALAGGQAGPRIEARTVTEGFAAVNVLCVGSSGR